MSIFSKRTQKNLDSKVETCKTRHVGCWDLGLNFGGMPFYLNAMVPKTPYLSIAFTCSNSSLM